MKLPWQKIPEHLAKTLKPIYLIAGDEPLLVEESAALVRQAAHTQGFQERIVLHAERGFNWQHLHTALQNLSLFSERTFVDLRLSDPVLPDHGKELIEQFSKKPSPHTTLLITLHKKADATLQKRSWFQAIDAIGVTVLIRPIKSFELLSWLKNQIKKYNLQIDTQGLNLLIACGEGNLLAIDQFLKKLQLTYTHCLLTCEEVKTVTHTMARFDIFGLTDSMVSGHGERVLNIFTQLKQEGTDAILILWAITRELRVLVNVSNDIQQGISLDKSLTVRGVWDTRKNIFKKAVARYDNRTWLQLLAHASQIDQNIKSAASNSVWDELLQLTLTISGIPLLQHTLEPSR